MTTTYHTLDDKLALANLRATNAERLLKAVMKCAEEVIESKRLLAVSGGYIAVDEGALNTIKAKVEKVQAEWGTVTLS